MAWYSLFVLKVPLNPKQTNKQTNSGSQWLWSRQNSDCTGSRTTFSQCASLSVSIVTAIFQVELMMMEVVVTTGAIWCAKLQSNHHHQQTNIQFFYRPDALPVTQPTVSKHWREKYHIPWTCLNPSSPGVFQLCLWPLIAPGYLGGWLPCLSSALWCQYPNKTIMNYIKLYKFPFVL